MNLFFINRFASWVVYVESHECHVSMLTFGLTSQLRCKQPEVPNSPMDEVLMQQ